MEQMLWDHVCENFEMRNLLDQCSRTLYAASHTAVQAVKPTTAHPETDTTSHQDHEQPHSPVIHGWHSIEECVEDFLADPSIVIQFCLKSGDADQLDEDNIPNFLGIFSLSHNFDCVLDALQTIFNRHLDGMPSISVGFVSSFLLAFHTH
jgi:hypothetical protein